MTKPHILQVGPYPEWDQRPLEEAYVVHRWWEAADKDALLAVWSMRLPRGATWGRAKR
jgi:hypothetical protein